MTEQSFYERVFELVRKIPEGRVTSYGALARAIGSARSSRLIGSALRASSIAHPPVPAHRVVNRNGMLTGKHAFGTETMMQQLLENESVKVENDIVVNFDEIFWDPADY